MPTVEGAGNDELLARSRAGDADAFCRLVAPEEARLFRQALALCGERAAAEDLVAETLVAAWQGVGRFDGRCRLSTWLYAILVHRFQKQLRRGRSRLPSASSVPGLDPAAGPHPEAEGRTGLSGTTVPTGAEAVEQAEREARMRQAMMALPEEHRSVLLLRFFEEATLDEIASALGIPVGTVKSRLHHGLVKLRRMEVVVNLREEWRDS